MSQPNSDIFGSTFPSIMRDPEFRRGFEEARRGAAFDWRIDDWGYGRGRLFAHIAPLNMTLFDGARPKQKALALLRLSFLTKFII